MLYESVQFMLVYAEKYMTEEKIIKNRLYKNYRQPRKSKRHKTQKNRTSLVQSLKYDTRLGNEVTLPSPHGAD